ncbi:MAG: short-chain dehydrogenase/reductase, partial [Ilumatobacteraceae bacterium]|nr:short-chain dehydrogenase/reductase [Ilumatobacteraceae bacterium]
AGAASVAVEAVDVTDAAEVDRVVTETVQRRRRVDVVVHAAMVMAYGRIEDLPVDVCTTVFDTALHGTANVARSVLPVLRAQHEGSLVIVTSLLSSVAVPEIGAYVAGKWGQLGLARVLELETADEPGVHVITTAPGAVDTPIYRQAANVTGRQGVPPPPVEAPDRVARAIVDAVDHGRRRAFANPANQVVVFGSRFVSPLYRRLVGPLYRRLATTGSGLAATAGNVLSPTGAGTEPDRPDLRGPR